MKSPAAVGKIADPMKRLTEAATLVREAETKAEEARARRDMATVIAHLDHGVAPVTLYRDTLQISRALFNRMIQRAGSTEQRQAIVAANPGVFDDPVKAAKDADRDVKRLTKTIEAAREIRDVTALMLMNGEDDEGKPISPVSNADVARATKLSTARIAQMRAGRR